MLKNHSKLQVNMPTSMKINVAVRHCCVKGLLFGKNLGKKSAQEWFSIPVNSGKKSHNKEEVTTSLLIWNKDREGAFVYINENLVKEKKSFT